MDPLFEQINRLTPSQASEALKNFKIALQHASNRLVSDDEVHRSLQAVQTTGDAARLRDAILTEASSIDGANWARGALAYLAFDPELRVHVEESVSDALQSSAKDFGLSTLIVLGTVLVLLKWRPTKVKWGKQGTTIDWQENEVSAVATLAQAVSGIPLDKKPAGDS